MLADGMVFTASYNGKITILKEGSAFEIINRSIWMKKSGPHLWRLTTGYAEPALL